MSVKHVGLWLIGAFFVLPVALGVIGTWLPAFGFLPGVGGRELGLDAFNAVLSYPGLSTSLYVTLVSVLLSTVLAFLFSQWLCLALYKRRLWRRMSVSLAPLMAVPHLAFAVGFSFLISPSGWLLRIVSPWLTGFELPPDWLILKDSNALSLALVLFLKEIPFFLLMSLSALTHFDAQKTLHIAQSLGYSRAQAWWKLVFVQMYPQLKLPFFAVLSYSLSVVDLSLVLGPSAPPTFAVLIDRWFNDADISYRLQGAAASVVLLALSLLLFVIYVTFERTLIYCSRHWLVAGPRVKAGITERLRPLQARLAVMLLWLCFIGAVSALILLSLSKRWRFPNLLPDAVSAKHWLRLQQALIEAAVNTLSIGLCATLIAGVFAIAVLEWQSRSENTTTGRASTLMVFLIYTPLLLPQVSFLFGVQVLYTYVYLDSTFAGVIWLHFIFVFPYVYLTLAKAYFAYDQHYLLQARSLGRSYLSCLVRVKLAMLTKPISFALATGFAVSSAQYLATIYAGGGRFETLTTLTVVLHSGSNLPLSAVAALWQMALPLIVYLMAIGLPALFFRRRQGM
ncbi:MAG: ABC transporter permease [Pseudomonadales bacterium]